MRVPRRTMIDSRARTLAGLLSAVLGLVLAAGCDRDREVVWQGYVEADFVYVATPLGGELVELAVARGQRVAAGEFLFALEDQPEAAAVGAAAGEAERAQEQLADLRKGQRPTELEALRASLNGAREREALSRAEYRRRRQLYADGVIPAEELDVAQTALRRDTAAVTRLENELATARLGGREDAVDAARAAVTAARARHEQARWALEEKRRSAPAAGLVFDTLYEVGEQVAAGRPVVSLLPPGNVKLRFFVPEPVVGTLEIGQTVRVAFDGAPRDYPATIDFISPEAEYTPPVIFSRRSRARLVYLVEARPEPADAPRLHPGQPIDVRPEATGE